MYHTDLTQISINQIVMHNFACYNETKTYMKYYVSIIIFFILFSFSEAHSQGCYYPAAFSYNTGGLNSDSGLANFTNTSTYITSSNWDFGDGSTSNLNHPSHTYSENGSYSVTLYITYVFDLGVYGVLNCNSTTSESVMISNILPSSINDLEALSVLIYPNPASNNLTVDYGDLNGVNTTIKLYDSSSKLIFEKQSPSTQMIDVSAFANGIYSIELVTDEHVLRSQVIIE
jgi:hypothetical protein